MPHASSDQARSRRVSQPGSLYWLLVLAAFGAAQLPLPFGLAALFFLACGFISGIRRMLAATRRGLGGRSVVMTALGLVLLGLLTMITCTRALIYPVQAAYEKCVAGAITEQASLECRAQLENGLFEYLGQQPPS